MAFLLLYITNLWLFCYYIKQISGLSMSSAKTGLLLPCERVFKNTVTTKSIILLHNLSKMLYILILTSLVSKLPTQKLRAQNVKIYG